MQCSLSSSCASSGGGVGEDSSLTRFGGGDGIALGGQAQASVRGSLRCFVLLAQHRTQLSPLRSPHALDSCRTMPSLPLTDPRLHWSSRWVFAPDSQKAVAHWAGATLRFFVRGTHVYIGTGDSERLDQYNGNLPMTMTRVSNTQTREHVEKFCELLEPTAIISAVDDEDLQHHGKDAVLCVELVLSDWASRLEVVSIVVDDVSPRLTSPPRPR